MIADGPRTRRAGGASRHNPVESWRLQTPSNENGATKDYPPWCEGDSAFPAIPFHPGGEVAVVDGVTVVIPTRDRWHRLRRTLALVLEQSHSGALEVIIVDDGGSDGTARNLEALGDRRIRVLRNACAGGVSAARNVGLAAATHPWVAFTDDDDLWSTRKLELQLAAVQARGGESWCAGASVTVLDDVSVTSRPQVPPAGPDIARLALADNPIPGGGSGVLASTALVRRVGGFDPALSLLADWDLWTRLALVAPFVPVHEILLAYVLHGGSMSLAADRAMAESATIWERYAGERARLDVTHYVGARPWIARNYARERRHVKAARLHAELAIETRRLRHVRAMAVLLCGPTVRALVPHRFKAGPPPPAAMAFGESLRSAIELAQRANGLDDGTWRVPDERRPDAGAAQVSTAEPPG